MNKRGVLLVCLALLLVGSLAVEVDSSSERARPSANEINAAIAAKGECWVAGENKFSNWTTDQLKRLLGAYPPGLDPVEGETETFIGFPEETGGPEVMGKPGPTLPTTFDWRTTGGVTSVKDQGNCGSCWAFSAVGQVEALYKIKQATTLDLSEQFLVSCETDNYGCDGGYMDRVYNFLKSTGTTDEQCFPYRESDLACSERCSDWAAHLTKISGWSWVSRTKANTTTIKTAVYSNGPLSCTMDVYYDFFDYQSGCYSHVTGAYAGGHAVLIVGWTADGCWIVKNSWGPGWGEQGYFKIKFGNCRIGSNSAKFTL